MSNTPTTATRRLAVAVLGLLTTVLTIACGASYTNRESNERTVIATSTPGVDALTCFSNYEFDLALSSDLAREVAAAETLVGPITLPTGIAFEAYEPETGIVPASEAGADPAFALELDGGAGELEALAGLQLVYSRLPPCVLEPVRPIATLDSSGRPVAIYDSGLPVDERVLHGLRAVWSRSAIYVDLLLLWPARSAPSQAEQLATMADWLQRFP